MCVLLLKFDLLSSRSDPHWQTHKNEGEEEDDDEEKEEEEERTEEGTNALAVEGAVGCRYSCKGELVGWEVTPRVTIEKR